MTQEMNREILVNVANTSLRTKLNPDVADVLTEVSSYLHHCNNLYYHLGCL